MKKRVAYTTEIRYILFSHKRMREAFSSYDKAVPKQI